ncbi:MAG: hypothetical protein PVSMB5_02660 [Ktedonobacteraceae bacterium]
MTAKLLTRGIIVTVVIGTLAIITLGLLQPAQSNQSNPVNGAGKQTRPGMQVGLQKGDAAPNFTLTTMDGQKVSLSNYRGRPVMLNFWMINCTGCQYEMPGMQKVYAAQQTAHKDLVILAVNSVDSARDIQQFARQRGLTYPILLDAHSATGQLYALRGTPTSYFIDRKGMIYSSSEGPIDEGALQEVVQQLDA